MVVRSITTELHSPDNREVNKISQKKTQDICQQRKEYEKSINDNRSKKGNIDKILVRQYDTESLRGETVRNDDENKMKMLQKAQQNKEI